MARDKLITKPFFKHDYDAAEDPKVEALRDAYGAEGYAVYFLTLEYLYRQEGKCISPLGVRSIAGKLLLSRERVVEVLDFASSAECECLLHKCPDGYYSDRVNETFAEARAIKRAESEKMKSVRKGNKNDEK